MDDISPLIRIQRSLSGNHVAKLHAVRRLAGAQTPALSTHQQSISLAEMSSNIRMERMCVQEHIVRRTIERSDKRIREEVKAARMMSKLWSEESARRQGIDADAAAFLRFARENEPIWRAAALKRETLRDISDHFLVRATTEKRHLFEEQRDFFTALSFLFAEEQAQVRMVARRRSEEMATQEYFRSNC